MVTCPVCEHQQELSFECEVCGKDLGGLGALGLPPPMVAPVEGLEVTVPEPIGEVPIERVGDLEVTHFAAVEVGTEATPDLEASRQPAVGEVPIDRVPDLTDDRAADDGVRTAAPTGAVTCVSCRQVNQAGTVLCVHCGVRLPRITARGATAARAAVSTRCRACGAPATAGARCGDCGREVPFPDA